MCLQSPWHDFVRESPTFWIGSVFSDRKAGDGYILRRSNEHSRLARFEDWLHSVHGLVAMVAFSNHDEVPEPVAARCANWHVRIPWFERPATDKTGVFNQSVENQLADVRFRTRNATHLRGVRQSGFPQHPP